LLGGQRHWDIKPISNPTIKLQQERQITTAVNM
jgi:hypothetical protein